jgi:hypothetical protein
MKECRDSKWRVGQPWNNFKINGGLNQVDILYEIPFNIAMERQQDVFQLTPNITIFTKTIKFSTCTWRSDNSMVGDCDWRSVSTAEERSKAGLKRNADKTKYMRVMRNSPWYVNIWSLQILDRQHSNPGKGSEYWRPRIWRGYNA